MLGSYSPISVPHTLSNPLTLTLYKPWPHPPTLTLTKPMNINVTRPTNMKHVCHATTHVWTDRHSAYATTKLAITHEYYFVIISVKYSHSTKIKIWLNGLELSFYEIWHLRLESAIASCDTSNKTDLYPSTFKQ